MKFYIVDAFTDQLFGGNPAGVIILDDGADFPDDERMRKTAAELRYSETAFIKRISEKEFKVRYFTPAAEVDLCGHATIGSFYALQAGGLIKAGQTYINETLAGRLEIEVSESSVLMDMGDPVAIGTIETPEALDELYRIMGVSPEERGGLLPEMISTGLPDIMMPVADEEVLAKISPDFAALTELSKRYEVVGVHAFTICDEKAVHCRNFAPLYDINEEAATGTSNGALTYYLQMKGLIKEGQENIFIQGEAMDRPSKITSKLTLAEGKIRIQVGGQASILAEGEIFI